MKKTCGRRRWCKVWHFAPIVTFVFYSIEFSAQGRKKWAWTMRTTMSLNCEVFLCDMPTSWYFDFLVISTQGPKTAGLFGIGLSMELHTWMIELIRCYSCIYILARTMAPSFSLMSTSHDVPICLSSLPKTPCVHGHSEIRLCMPLNTCKPIRSQVTLLALCWLRLGLS